MLVICLLNNIVLRGRGFCTSSIVQITGNVPRLLADIVAVNMCGEHNFYLELLLMPAASALDIEKSVEETILNGAAESLKPW